MAGHRQLCKVLASIAAAICLSPVLAQAQSAGDIDRRVGTYELEVRAIAADILAPSMPGSTQRLVDAQVAYGIGEYSTAIKLLFNLVGRPGQDSETATYYLAESLFQKGDRSAARTYFAQLAGNAVPGKYYQPSLLRLVELAVQQNDRTGVDDWLAALDRIPVGSRSPAVPYVRGKFAYSQGQLDQALTLFAEVAQGSEYELPAAYFSATTYVAKKDLAKATEIFTDLIARKARNAKDRRVIELSQLALGRIFYERDQHTHSIDSYLLIDRHSDLFPDALYEVAWVYVKNKQYDKALRALELLAQSDPQSTKTPTVKILEGNLRIRKAQMIRAAQIAGTQQGAEDPLTEYEAANHVFSETHNEFKPAFDALAKVVDSHADASQVLAQISDHVSDNAFQIVPSVPEAAVQWLHEQPEIARYLDIDSEVSDIRGNLRDTGETIARLEGVLAAPDKTNVYPALAAKRSRLAAISNDLIKLRNMIADQASVTGSATEERRQLAQQYAALPDPSQTYSDQLNIAAQGYDRADQAAMEVGDLVGGANAMAVALRKFSADSNTPLTADQRNKIQTTLDAAGQDAQALNAEISDMRREIALGRDLAGFGDDSLAKARELRRQVRAAQDAESQTMSGNAVAQHAAQLAEEIEQADSHIEQLVGAALNDMRVQLTQERSNLVQFQQEIDEIGREATALGHAVLPNSFQAVKDKFYDVVIRTDVGNVDVAWSRKSDSDDDLKRLNLSRSREMKQLRDEFKDILDAGTPKPSAPKPAEPMPKPQTGDPDQGGGDKRVSAGTGGASSAPSAVKPDDGKAGKKADKNNKKKAGSK